MSASFPAIEIPVSEWRSRVEKDGGLRQPHLIKRIDHMKVSDSAPQASRTRSQQSTPPHAAQFEPTDSDAVGGTGRPVLREPSKFQHELLVITVQSPGGTDHLLLLDRRPAENISTVRLGVTTIGAAIARVSSTPHKGVPAHDTVGHIIESALGYYNAFTLQSVVFGAHAVGSTAAVEDTASGEAGPRLEDLAVLANAAYQCFPRYNSSEMCFFFAGLIISAVCDIWHVQAVDSARADQMGRINSIIIRGQFGKPEPTDIRKLVAAYKVDRAKFMIETAEEAYERGRQEERRGREEEARGREEERRGREELRLKLEAAQERVRELEPLPERVRELELQLSNLLPAV